MPKKKATSNPVDSSKAVMPAPELTLEEQARVEAWGQREKARKKAPRFRVSQDKGITIGPDIPDNKLPLWAEDVQNATGFKATNQGANYVANVAQAITPFNGQADSAIQKSLNDTVALVLEMRPEDATEALLVGQMLASNNAALDCMRRAMLTDQTAYGREFNLKFADRFMRTYTAQMEALTKYRKGGQQKVVVEHVHVYRGGQAIVGNVNHTGGGRDGLKNNGTTPCPHAIGTAPTGIPLRLADGQEVWCEMQKVGPALPATGDA